MHILSPALMSGGTVSLVLVNGPQEEVVCVTSGVEAIESFVQLIYLFPCSGHQMGQIIPERAVIRC